MEHDKEKSFHEFNYILVHVHFQALSSEFPNQIFNILNL